jgi:cytoskeletal protein CcmA (bactofilin family)
MAQFPTSVFRSGTPTPSSFPAPPPPPSPVGPPRARGEFATEQRTLIVGRGISLQGTINDADRLVVEGIVQSEMLKAVDLTIAEGGVFKGTIQVERAVVSGAFEGNLTAVGELLVSRTGRLTGTARYGRLVVENGGEIFGTLEVGS